MDSFVFVGVTSSIRFRVGLWFWLGIELGENPVRSCLVRTRAKNAIAELSDHNQICQVLIVTIAYVFFINKLTSLKSYIQVVCWRAEPVGPWPHKRSRHEGRRKGGQRAPNRQRKFSILPPMHFVVSIKQLAVHATRE